MKRAFVPCLILALVILLAVSCAPGDSSADARAHEQTREAAEKAGFTGMGGADGLLPAERPGEDQAKTEKASDLYYFAYSVRKGDIVGNIAKEHGVSQDAIISLNHLKNTRTLQIGQILKIPSINGILYTVKKGDTAASIADTYHVSLERTALLNDMHDNAVTAGSTIFLPDAKLDRVTIQEINGDLFSKPLHGGYYISSRYGWRNNPFIGSRTFHNGVDMACPRGTPVYAALDGVVSSTGYSVTYGNYIIVSHHSGYRTMYAHLNVILTSAGKRVSPTSRIGQVGNTGQSTGPHLHFSVFKRGATINPANLWN